MILCSYEVLQVDVELCIYIYFRIDAHLSVKVGDFGFSRDIYNIDYYHLERKTRLPVKWLPPESLFDNKYDEKTDVVCAAYTMFKLAVTTLVTKSFLSDTVGIWCYMLGGF